MEFCPRLIELTSVSHKGPLLSSHVNNHGVDEPCLHTKVSSFIVVSSGCFLLVVRCYQSIGSPVEETHNFVPTQSDDQLLCVSVTEIITGFKRFLLLNMEMDLK